MSFEEIARELGVTRNAAWMAYKKAIRKLSQGKRLKQLEVILQLSRSKEQ